ncbi:MAG: sigma-54-dependent Fis family transcriptional regulator [Deltaproteobacteria bacterium]|nr:sigma-54-dependent Fis family transcriptional regulator [Deltaproteobacteria bacterium]
MLSLALSKDGFHVWTASSGQEGLQVLGTSEPFDVCVTDVRMPGMDGLAFIEEGCRLGPKAPTFIAMSAYGDEALAVEALRRGAFDYISKPFEPAELSLKLKLVVERKNLGREGEERPTRSRPSPRVAPERAGRPPPGLEEVVSAAPAMQSIFRLVRKVADFPTTVLITGETGTGKERIAGAIHSEGRRRGSPFVAINCGAIPENLLESELFGYVKGAFTDAKEDRPGLFESAHGGTLFLDEVAELGLNLQVKLLRALVEKEIRRVGDTRTIPVDVRVIAATAKPMDALVAQGAFREDLYYRLNVVRVELPPLRDRREDIPVLARHFVAQLGDRLGLARASINDEALERLYGYDWPGNVRELENALERALVLSEGDGRITEADLDHRFDPDAGAPRVGKGLDPLVEADELSLKVVIPKVERILIRRALERTGGNRTKASILLGISHRALLYKLKEHDIK